MTQTQSAGGVVLNSQGRVLVVSQRGRSWSLPKGHIEAGEDILAAARREIYEESGLKDLVLVKLLGSYVRAKIGKEGGEDRGEMKHLTFYLFKAASDTLKPIDPDNPEARWIARDQVSAMLTHPKDKVFFESFITQLDGA